MHPDIQDPTQIASVAADLVHGAAGHDTVRLSLPEISSLVYRVTRGAGRDWGQAEETANAAKWLAARGLPWADAVLSRLQGVQGRAIRPAIGDWASEGAACAISTGVALMDFATLPEGRIQPLLCLGAILDPILLLPFVARVARLQGQTIQLELDDASVASVRRDETLFVADAGLPTRAKVVLRAPQTGPDLPGRPLQPRPEPVSQTCWQRLDSLALRMCVPTSDTSAQRAGATGDDND